MSESEETSVEPSGDSTLQDEIDLIKQNYNCKVIENNGLYRFILKVALNDYDVSVKFQIPEGYPVIRPTVIVTWKSISDTSLADGLRFLILQQPTITTMLSSAQQWLQQHPQLLSKEGEKKEKRRKNKKMKSEDEKEDFKKSSMKTAIDVISRIQWDGQLESDTFTVGYVDRFLGIVEKSFSILSWDDPASVDDHEVLAIPKHRIEYFKYRDFIVWEKKTRTDYVFGSSGEKKMTIYDVIERYDELVPKTEENGEFNEEMDSDDDDDDGIEISLGSTEQCEDAYWRNKLRPNYFIAVRINDPDILTMVGHLQDTILERQPEYESCCIPLTAPHITLCTLRLDNLEQTQNAVKIINELKPELENLKSTIKLDGTGLFNERVFFAKVHYEEKFMEMVNGIRMALVSVGIALQDGKDFVPHMTIMKTNRPVSRLMGKAIPKSIYSGSEYVHFGQQMTDNINLCSIEESWESDGFYKCLTKLQI